MAIAALSLNALSLAQVSRSVLWGVAGLVFLAIAVTGAFAWSMARSVRSPIDEAVDIAQRIAEVDASLDHDNRADAEMARLQSAVGVMQDRLRTMVGSGRESTPSSTPAAESMLVTAGAKAARTETVAMPTPSVALAEAGMSAPARSSAAQESSSATRESAMPQRVAQELIDKAAAAAKRSGEVVTQVVTNLDEISSSSRKIAEVIGIIDGIAFQTNVLALNAAVEAARAGDQGKGFAVVAGEVRTLAQRAASAAKEIKTLINNSVEKVESGGKLVRDAGSTMDAIVGSVQKVTDIIGKINTATGDASVGIETVNAAVSQLDQMTQQNAALVSQSASAAESLRAQAERLQKVVGAFRLLQQTQQAAWTAHSAIEGARVRARSVVDAQVTRNLAPYAAKGPYGGAFEERRGRSKVSSSEKVARNWGAGPRIATIGNRSDRPGLKRPA